MFSFSCQTRKSHYFMKFTFECVVVVWAKTFFQQFKHLTKARSLIKTNVQTLPQSASNYLTSVDFRFDNSPEMRKWRKLEKSLEKYENSCLKIIISCDSFPSLKFVEVFEARIKLESLNGWKNSIQERNRRCQLQRFVVESSANKVDRECSTSFRIELKCFSTFCRFILAIERMSTQKQLDEKFIADSIEPSNNLTLQGSTRSLHEILRMRESTSKQSLFKLRFAIKFAV